MRANTVEDFWSRFDKTGDCWVWTGYTQRYGIISFGGERRRVHQLAYELTKGAIPSGKVVRHSCDNPICGRPEHLLLGTQGDNVRDMLDRGRNVKPKGAAHHKTKLTLEIVQDILRRTDETPNAIGERYGISGQTVVSIRKGRNSCANHILTFASSSAA